jgi:hypothetical protein
MSHEKCNDRIAVAYAAFVVARQRLTNATNRYGGSRRTYRGNAVSSRFKGVSRRADGSWIVRSHASGRSEYVGCFCSEEQAARSYDQYVKRHWGTNCFLNFPDEHGENRP